MQGGAHHGRRGAARTAVHRVSTSSITTLAAARMLSVHAAQRRPSTPAELAQAIIPGFRITPAVVAISDALAEAMSTPDARLIITAPPREGKSTLSSVVGTLFALSRNPDARIILASYADSLAQEHSRAARALVAEYPELLGFTLDATKTSAARWQVEGRKGSLLAVGILSGVTGFGADGLLLDDVIKNAVEADSAAHRRRVLHEFRSTLLTRVHPGGSVIVLGTRWNEDDLIGSLLRDEPDVWRHINIPAIGEPESDIPDVLGRPSGVAMTSALGRTPQQFDDLRRSVASRSWYALFQGSPTTPEGGLFKTDWFDAWRMPAAPQHPIKSVIGVDPSDSGSGDACGLVAGSLCPDGTVALVADVSEPLTAEQWSRRAVELAISVGASEISVESFASGTTYVAMVNDAIRRMRPPHPIRATFWPPRGSNRGRGDAEARSAGLRQALEVGTCRVAGHLPALEQQAVQWQSGQHQPDAVAAATIVFDVLAHARGQRTGVVSPIDAARRVRERDPAEILARRRRLGRSIDRERYDPLAFPWGSRHRTVPAHRAAELRAQHDER